MASESFKNTCQKKRKNVGEGSSSSQQEEHLPSLHVSHFTQDKSLNAFKTQMKNRSIYIERPFGEDFLVQINYTWLEKFKEWGWMDFLRINEDVRPNLVKLFYFFGDHKNDDDNDNEMDDESDVDIDDHFSTKVLGQKMVINEEFIRTFVSDKKNNGATRVLKGQALIDSRVVYNNPNLMAVENSCSKMNGCTRVLHYVVSQVFFPRAGNYSEASKRDLFIMARIIEGNPPNLSAIILSRMLELVKMMAKRGMRKTNDYNLPYGKLVSRICGRICEVPDDEQINNKGEMEPLSLSSLTTHGWVQDPETRKYVRKPELEEPTNLQLMEKMTTFFGELKTEIQEVKNRQQVLEAQNLHIYNHMRAQETEVVFEEPFPSFENFQYPPP